MPRAKKTPSLPLLSSEPRRVSTEWLIGLDAEQKATFEGTWRNSTYVLNQLKRILQRQQAALETDKEDDYDNPSWTVLRADRNGQLRTLKEILRLLP